MNIFSQLISAQLEVLAADPTAGLAPGRVYFNSVTACPRFYDGARWVQNTASGEVRMTANTVASPGFILLTSDAQQVSKTTYPTLFAALGYRFGGAADLFNLPPAPGRTIVAAGSATGLTTRNLGDVFGEETHTLTTSELPAHSHGVNDPGHAHTTNAGGSDSHAGGTSGTNPSYGATATSTNGTGITIQNTGGGASHNNIQPSLALNFMIKI